MMKILKYLVLFIGLMMMPGAINSLSAQPPPPPADAIPIDGGLISLVIAGAAYGARRLYKQQKEGNVE